MDIPAMGIDVAVEDLQRLSARLCRAIAEEKIDLMEANRHILAAVERGIISTSGPRMQEELQVEGPFRGKLPEVWRQVAKRSDHKTNCFRRTRIDLRGSTSSARLCPGRSRFVRKHVTIFQNNETVRDRRQLD